MDIKKIIQEEVNDFEWVGDSNYIDMDVDKSYKIWTFDWDKVTTLSYIERLKDMNVTVSPNARRDINKLLSDEYDGRYKIVYMIVSPSVKGGEINSEGQRWLNLQTNWKDEFLRDSFLDEFSRVRSIELT